jgi:hypothetical protein
MMTNQQQPLEMPDADAQFDARATLAGAYDHLPISILSQ